MNTSNLIPDRSRKSTLTWVPSSIQNAVARDGDIYASGKCSYRGREKQGTLWFLGRFDTAGREVFRYFETTIDETDGTNLVEVDRYFEIYQPWAIDHTGCVYLATDYNEYVIDVIERDGTHRARIVPPHPYQPLARAKLQMVRSIVDDPAQSETERSRLAAEIRALGEAGRSAYHPCVRSLRISECGELWVANGHCGQDPRDSGRNDVTVFRYDVFTQDGVLDRRVVIEIPGEVPLGELHWIGDDEFVVVDTTDTIEIVNYRLDR